MAATAAVPNIYEQHARQVKAMRLTDTLDALNITSSQARTLSPSHWKCLIQVAEVRPPSEDTKRLAVDMLGSREQLRSRMANYLLESFERVDRCERYVDELAALCSEVSRSTDPHVGEAALQLITGAPRRTRRLATD